MSLINKIKNMFKKEEQKKYGMPYEYLKVAWKKNIEEMNMSGDRAKKILHIKGGKVIMDYDYTLSKVRKLQNNLRIPVYNPIKNMSRPDKTLAEQVRPDVIDVRRL